MFNFFSPRRSRLTAISLVNYICLDNDIIELLDKHCTALEDDCLIIIIIILIARTGSTRAVKRSSTCTAGQ